MTRVVTVLALTLVGGALASSSAYAETPPVPSGGCVTEFVRYFSINPFNPVPVVTHPNGSVSVDYTGTEYYAQDDTNDVQYFADCLV